MGRFVIALAASGLIVGVAWSDLAGQQNHADDVRRSTGNLRPGHRTAVPAMHGSPPPDSDGHPVYRPYHFGHFPRYQHFPPGYGFGYGPYYYDPYLPYFYPPGYYREYRYIAPLYVPGEALYGPKRMKRFMGAGRIGRPGATRRRVVPTNGDGPPEDPPNLRGTGREAVARGWRFIGSGDVYFGQQEYRQAYLRYKKAATAAPALADAYFRQGYALLALGNYDSAAKALRRGLAIDPGWASSGFHNDELYENHRMAKTAHIESLTQAATEEPNNADLLFLLGVYLYFDGQVERAAGFFEQAARVESDASHLKGFLEQIGKAER